MRFPWVTENLNIKSITNTFVIISFILSIASICLSHKFISCLPASCLSISLFALVMLFSRLHNIDSFKLNVKTGDIEASDENHKN